MCGISGLVLREGESAEEQDLERMARSMIRRGPDSEGVCARKNVGLAHRRLKIIDLSDAANQPMFSPSGDLAIVFNGEIYNFMELRKELEGSGHRFRTRSDTEVLLHAFEEWGTECFRRLNGIFAFAIWDGRRGHSALYLVRDRFGIKPLFYSIEQGRLAFASELKPLFLVPWVRSEVSRDALHSYLRFSHVPGQQSILEGVRQLSPGTWLRFEKGRAGFGTYWDPLEMIPSGHVRRSNEAVRENELLEELEQVLRAVVKRQLISDVPVGCFLSGGIDSSLLVAAYSDLGLPPIKTFNIGYKEKEFDESAHARGVANAFGTDHFECIVRAEDMIGIIPEVPDFFDQPFADPTLLSTLLIMKFARQSVTVALSGDGGDELFFGYPHQKALRLFSWLDAVSPRGRRGLFSLIERAVAPWSHRYAKLSEMLQFEDQSELFQYFIGMIGPMRFDRLGRLLKDLPSASESAYAKMHRELGGLSSEDRITQVFVRTFLVDTVLAKTDRCGMAYGLEARVPFLDNEMVEFSSRLPFRWKYREGTSKYLLRKLLERKIGSIPSADVGISRRPKQGFSIPMRDWLRGDLKYLLDEYLSKERLKREGYFEPEGVSAVVRAHLGGKANHSHLLWTIISFQMWKERYLS